MAWTTLEIKHLDLHSLFVPFTSFENGDAERGVVKHRSVPKIALN